MVVESCYVEGVSLSAVAIAHGLNPNMVRRWVTDFETGVKDLPILNKDRLFALIAAGGGRSEQLQTASPIVHVAEPTNCSDSKECRSTTHDDCSDSRSSESETVGIGDFLPIKVQPSSSPPCRVEIQVRKMDSNHSLHIALASATVNDCVTLLREFLQ